MTTTIFKRAIQAFDEGGQLVLGYEVEFLVGTSDAFILFAEDVNGLRRVLRKFKDTAKSHQVKVVGIYDSPEFQHGAKKLLFEGWVFQSFGPLAKTREYLSNGCI